MLSTYLENQRILFHWRTFLQWCHSNYLWFFVLLPLGPHILRFQALPEQVSCSLFSVFCSSSLWRATSTVNCIGGLVQHHTGIRQALKLNAALNRNASCESIQCTSLFGEPLISEWKKLGSVLSFTNAVTSVKIVKTIRPLRMGWNTSAKPVHLQYATTIHDTSEFHLHPCKLSPQGKN